MNEKRINFIAKLADDYNDKTAGFKGTALKYLLPALITAGSVGTISDAFQHREHEKRMQGYEDAEDARLRKEKNEKAAKKKAEESKQVNKKLLNK